MGTREPGQNFKKRIPHMQDSLKYAARHDIHNAEKSIPRRVVENEAKTASNAARQDSHTKRGERPKLLKIFFRTALGATSREMDLP